jgi:hypothetical protein
MNFYLVQGPMEEKEPLHNASRQIDRLLEEEIVKDSLKAKNNLISGERILKISQSN